MPMKTKQKLSTLWILVVANILLADILSAFIAFGDPSVVAIPGDPRTIMAVSALILNIPIAMIYLSHTLKPKMNRNLNIAAAIATLLFVIGGASSLPHYIVIAAIETIILVMIIRVSWKSSFEK